MSNTWIEIFKIIAESTYRVATIGMMTVILVGGFYLFTVMMFSL